jgi:tetratricopeptide (TPR) repeat protein
MKIMRLFTIILAVIMSSYSNAQTLFKTEKIFPQLLKNTDITKAKENISDIMIKEIKIAGPDIKTWGNPKDVLISDNNIEFTVKGQKGIIKFSDILDETIVVDEISMSENNGPYYLIRYELHLGSYIFYFRMDYTSATKFANNLYFLQRKLRNEFYSSHLEQFIPVAAKYRELKEKPAISEEMRRFIVQANAFNEKKQYAEAIESYNRAIRVDPTSYPAAYSNLALLSAQINRYDAAIFYMKEYLLLVPDASDARTAQDKIYEWESAITE